MKTLVAAALVAGGWVGWKLPGWVERLTDAIDEDNGRRDKEIARAVLDAMEDLWGPASMFTPPWEKPKAGTVR